jgi:CBS domain-containing protein
MHRQVLKGESMGVQGDSEALVVDLMAGDPIVVGPDLAVVRVAQILADYDIGGLPVVDADGRLVGLVSQTDLVRLWASSVASSSWPSLVVRDVMTKPAVTIRGSASLTQAAQAMTNADVHRLVVVGDDAATALGVISDSDLVRALPR